MENLQTFTREWYSSNTAATVALNVNLTTLVKKIYITESCPNQYYNLFIQILQYMHSYIDWSSNLNIHQPLASPQSTRENTKLSKIKHKWSTYTGSYKDYIGCNKQLRLVPNISSTFLIITSALVLLLFIFTRSIIVSLPIMERVLGSLERLYINPSHYYFHF